MNLFLVLAGCSIVFWFAYKFYGGRLARWLELDPKKQTPSHEVNDGIDFVPTSQNYLLGQHLSAIAAAGPIIGPILAALWFGWLPAVLWILFGAVLIGGVHDMTSLVASVRHRAKSIAEIIRIYMSARTFKMFLLFLWLSLVYIITAFTDITAGTFTAPDMGSEVASSSMLYLGLALIMGTVMKWFRWPLWLSSSVFFPLVFVSIYLGKVIPLTLPTLAGMDLRSTWDVYLLAYCFVAAVIPVWLLLQPRGYLGGAFLVVTTFVSLACLVLGCFLGRFDIHYPAWIASGVSGTGTSFPLFPVLFTTIACGACSGFHALVASGTTAKQLDRESDAKAVGYGGMLLEGMVALIALSTLMVLTPKVVSELKDPNLIYASGIASFLNVLHIPKDFAMNFALLAFATFVYDTLDVTTRLGRYLFEELTGIRNRLSPYLGSLATLALPLFFVTFKMTDPSGQPVAAWKVFWSVFGASNQLLAGFVLFSVSIWLFRVGKKFIYALLPAFFMMAVAAASLVYLIGSYVGGGLHQPNILLISVTASVLLFLGAWLFVEGVSIFWRYRKR